MVTDKWKHSVDEALTMLGQPRTRNMSGRILVLEDEAPIADLLSGSLEDMGYSMVAQV